MWRTPKETSRYVFSKPHHHHRRKKRNLPPHSKNSNSHSQPQHRALHDKTLSTWKDTGKESKSKTQNRLEVASSGASVGKPKVNFLRALREESALDISLYRKEAAAAASKRVRERTSSSSSSSSTSQGIAKNAKGNSNSNSTGTGIESSVDESLNTTGAIRGNGNQDGPVTRTELDSSDSGVLMVPELLDQKQERESAMWCDHSHIERAPQTEQPQRGRCFLCALTCDPVTHLDRAGTR